MNINLDNIIKISGSNEGPKSVILVGVHGNESCGVNAIEQLLPQLQIEAGELVIAFGNPKAINQGVRFTEENLNRMFLPESELTDKQKQSYEFSRALKLKEILAASEVLLDIHASNNPTSQPFVICEPNAKDIYPYLPIETVVHGFDAIEPGGTDYYMNSIGKVGVCIECGYIGDPKSTITATNSIIAFLQARGHIPGLGVVVEKNTYEMFYLHKTNYDNFRLLKPFADFEEVKRNQAIGLDGGESVVANEDSIILFAKDITTKDGEAFLLGRKIK